MQQLLSVHQTELKGLADTWKAAAQEPQTQLVQGLFYVPSRVNTGGHWAPHHLPDTTKSHRAIVCVLSSISKQTDDVMLHGVCNGLWESWPVCSGLRGIFFSGLTHFRWFHAQFLWMVMFLSLRRANLNIHCRFLELVSVIQTACRFNHRKMIWSRTASEI